jgi:hypothetical protein
MLFETTDTFLREFGLTSVTDLPPMEMLMVGTLRGIEHALDPSMAGPDDAADHGRPMGIRVDAGMMRSDDAAQTDSLLDTEALYREEETPG